MDSAPVEWKRNTRYSLRQLECWAEEGYRKPLDDLFRAFKGIQDLPLDDPNSYWVIAGYHGIPLAPFDPEQPHLPPPFAWWGGFCHHGNVLFPMWHRAYVQHLENALRTQVPDVTMAYWDKGSKGTRNHGLPASLTDEFIKLDGEIIRNPLQRFTFPVDIEPSARFKSPTKPAVADFSKRAGTHTVRYPMSTFYASKDEMVAATGEEHNAALRKRYPTYDDQLRALNLNIRLALVGDAQDDLSVDCDGTADGETYARLGRCLEAPNFNILSNNNSTGKWYTSVEQPHDEIHLAIGGQDHRPIKAEVSKTYDKFGNLAKSTKGMSAQIMGSHGDMGENETAAFDPVFFFHHCNIDRMIWIWQKKWGKTAKDSITIDPSDMEGTYGQSPSGQGGTRAVPGTTKLTMDTPLHPFKLPSGEWVTSRDLVDINNQLGMDYSFGSFDKEEWPSEVVEKPGPEIILSVVNINKANFLGSFKVTVSHEDPVNGTVSPIASVSVLSRWNLKRCKNCKIHISRDVHVDITPVKRRFALKENADVTKHTYIVDFVDRGCSDEKPVAASGRFVAEEFKLTAGREKIDLSLKDESRLGLAGEYFDIGTMIVLLDGDTTVMVNRDNHGTTASFELDEQGLKQTDVWVWGSSTDCRALLASTRANYYYVLYTSSDGDYTMYTTMEYWRNNDFPIGHFASGTLSPRHEAEDVFQAEISSLNVVGVIQHTLVLIRAGMTPSPQPSAQMVTGLGGVQRRWGGTWGGRRPQYFVHISDSSSCTSASTSACTSAYTSAYTSAHTSAHTSALASAHTSAHTSADTSAHTSADTSAHIRADTSAHASARFITDNCTDSVAYHTSAHAWTNGSSIASTLATPGSSDCFTHSGAHLLRADPISYFASYACAYNTGAHLISADSVSYGASNTCADGTIISSGTCGCKDGGGLDRHGPPIRPREAKLSASSQEVNGSYALVPCDELFSATSSATLGTGCSGRFTSSSILTVQLGRAYTIRPSSGSNCTDGDNTSVFLLEGIARTEIGAFLSTAAGCVAVGHALDPDPPFVEISAPEVVGCCDDLVLEGIASYPSTDIALNWTVDLADGDQAFDLADARTVLRQAGVSNELFVTLPSDSLATGSSYTFGLRVTTALGVWSETQIEVFKSADTMPALKIAGSAFRQLWRGLQVSIRTEVSSPRSQDGNATYTWTVVSEDSSTTDFPPLVLTRGRNPSVLTIPPYTLGYAGSRYMFKVELAGGDQGAASATATVEVVSGDVIAFISGGTARNLGASQALYLNASESIDDDKLDEILHFRWNCTDDKGAGCKSPSSAVLDMESYANGGLLTLPPDTLPSGVLYNFGVTVFKGSIGVTDWSELRSDHTVCTVSTFEGVLPHVTISPKTILRKYNPSERMILYGCATSSAGEACTSSTSSLFDLEWGQASALSLAYELSCFPGEACGTGHLTYPEDTLRDARVAATLLRKAPQTLASDVDAVLALQANIVGLIVNTYFSLEAASSSILAGSQALADALVVVNDNESPSSETLAEASRAVADMAATVTEQGALLDDASAESLVSVVSVLFDGASASPTHSSSSAIGPSSPTLVDKGSYVSVLADVGHALAFEAEVGEELHQIRGGSLAIQPAKVDAIALPATTISVGDNGTHVSFGAWENASDQDPGNTRTFSAAVFASGSSALDGVTVVDAWDSAGVRQERFVEPIGIFMALTDPESIDVGLETEGLMGHLGCGCWSEDGNGWRADGMVLGAIRMELDENNADLVECDTFHLSAFTSGQDSTTPQWSPANLLTGFSVLAEYGAESWASLLFLACVAAVLVVPAAWFARKDADQGTRRECISALRSTYLARGKGRREVRPLKKRVVVESVFFTHSWRHLSGSPATHFKNTLLTRPQHLVLLLADWMSAIMVQAVFYGKSQFGVRQKVEMTVVSAVFMLPTGLIFPALLRAANTPPASQTLNGAEDLIQNARNRVDDEISHGNQGLQPGVHLVREYKNNNTRPVRAVHLRDHHRDRVSPFSATATVGETTAYMDVVEMQKMLMLVHLPLPILLAMLVSEVLRVARESQAAGGDEYAFLHNMATSLSIACSVLCTLSAFAVVSRNARVMIQASAFQAVVAPGLALCGVLLYSSSAAIATGAVLGAGMALVGSYLVGVQQKYESILNEIIEGDLVAAWSNPSRNMHTAAETIQCCFRVYHASQRMTRALEFHTWLYKCRRRRHLMQTIAGGAVVTTILCLTYINMVFAAKFDRATSADWLTTCVLALLVETVIQQPAALLATAVLGDFVEEGANLLMDLL
eukprot:g5472.t1